MQMDIIISHYYTPCSPYTHNFGMFVISNNSLKVLLLTPSKYRPIFSLSVYGLFILLYCCKKLS